MVRHERTTEDDRERLRLARLPSHYTDAKVRGTMNAYTAMVRGELKRDRVDTVAPDGELWERNTPAAIAAALERSLIGPAIMAEPCPICGAAAGRYCYESCRGLCGPRVHRAVVILADRHLSNLEMT